MTLQVIGLDEDQMDSLTNGTKLKLMVRQTNKWTDGQIEGQTDRLTCSQTDGWMDRWADRQIDKLADRQKDRPTEGRPRQYGLTHKRMDRPTTKHQDEWCHLIPQPSKCYIKMKFE